MLLNNKKIRLILPLLHENKIVTNFLEKTELFHSYFSKQCSLIDNRSTLLAQMQYLTNSDLASVTFSQDGIAKIDNISLRMLQICGSPIFKPLITILKLSVDTVVFQSEWKKGNIVPIHKKATNKH